MPLYSSRHPYGMTAGEVQAAGCSLLLGIRQWIETRRPPRTAGAAVTLPGATVCRPGHHPARIAGAWRAGPGPVDITAGGQENLAAKVFRDTLLSLPGSDFALGPPDGPGALLSRAW